MKTDFLARIIADKKSSVAAAKRKVPESSLQEAAARPRQRRPFYKRLQQPGPSGINIIAEIKRASPSKGMIRNDLNPALLAQAYERGGAATLSILTEETYFKGSVHDLTAARAATSLPVLRKDFIVSTYQLYESAVIEADAVLLIVRILSHNQLQEYLDLCHQLRLDPLVEIHNERDLETASAAGAQFIGINNRDLSSFHTDLQTAVCIKSLLTPQQVAVAASGIATRKDIEKNLQVGIFNFLIGESLMKADDPEIFLKSMMKPTG